MFEKTRAHRDAKAARKEQRTAAIEAAHNELIAKEIQAEVDIIRARGVIEHVTAWGKHRKYLQLGGAAVATALAAVVALGTLQGGIGNGLSRGKGAIEGATGHEIDLTSPNIDIDGNDLKPDIDVSFGDDEIAMIGSWPLVRELCFDGAPGNDLVVKSIILGNAVTVEGLSLSTEVANTEDTRKAIDCSLRG